MSVERTGDTIRLFGACGAQDAETLALELLRQRSSSIDASSCVSMHGAVLQVLLAFKPKLRNQPYDPALSILLNQALSDD